MGRRAFPVAVVTALSVLILLHTSLCATARPLARVANSEAPAFAVAPSVSEGAPWRADIVARVGKWLPFAGGGFHYPSYPGYPAYHGYPVGRAAMWVAGAPPALDAFRAGRQLVKAVPYVDVTRQEQAAMWASLLKPWQSQRPTTTWLPPNGEPEDAHDEAEPKALVAAEGEEMDVPAGGGGVQPKWRFNSGNNGE